MLSAPMEMHFATKGMRGSASDAAGSGVTAQRRDRRFSLIAAFALSCCVALQVGSAQLTILHNFGDGTVPNDGVFPFAGLIQAPDGNFYGATSSGTVFRMTPAGNLGVIHTFKPNPNLGPTNALLYYNGELFGTIPKGRYDDIVFGMKLSGRTVVLHTFESVNTPKDGYSPEGSLILGSDGYLYGTTELGGGSDSGTIFKVNPASPYQFTSLYSFGNGGGAPKAALLLAKDGNYYGTTFVGNSGTIFQVTPAGQVTIVHQFATKIGNAGPAAPLIQANDGNFYGTTLGGGKYGHGSVFKMTPKFSVTTLHSFGLGTDGSVANSALVQGPNGNLYGVTFGGGTAKLGTIFEISTDGSSYTILHNFYDGSVTNDGGSPNGPLTVGSDNNLYGTTEVGGSADRGTVFKISP
jgi:uncharacterized repeat protein (TIGR03803 family)